jgi:tetratricopeptide (TPR) repeat protein
VSIKQVATSRNAPCPCGSGRRYKDCHGGIGAQAADAQPDPSRQRRLAILQEALAAQQAGRLDEAHAKYEAVIREEPSNFDALHMLGVVCMQLDRLERAEALVLRALDLRSDAAAKYNLEIIRQARRLEARESELCRSVLPRLAHLLRPASEIESWLRSPRGVVHFVIADHDASPALMERIAPLLPDSTIARTWLAAPDLAFVSGELKIEPGSLATETFAADDLVIVVGTGMPVGSWTLQPVPAFRVLLITRDAPCELLDRLRELSGEGRTGVLPCFIDAALRDASALPGASLDELAAALMPGATR